MLYIAAPFGNYLFTRKTRSVLGTYTLDGWQRLVFKKLPISGGQEKGM